MTADINKLLGLSPEEKRRLAEMLWDSLEQDDQDMKLSEEEKELLQKRWDDLQAGKSNLRDWQDIKQEIFSSSNE